MEQLLVGLWIPNDNLNLAVHEFARALSSNVADKINVRSFLFIFTMKKMTRLLLDDEFISKWEKKSYFRKYGKTNAHEFFTVTNKQLLGVFYKSDSVCHAI